MPTIRLTTLTTILSLLLSSTMFIPALALYNQNRGNSGIEMLLAAGILAKLLNRKHHHHKQHHVPIHIPVPVHHGGNHEVIHHGHHDHHGYGSSNYYDYASAYGMSGVVGGYGGYAAAPSQYMPIYY
ncbi:hypothetical protein JTE90_001371 [Oedothorax gibbosus]|uniref:Uncharacterized protein n=1 Tax=Oedothorax gibbosus TaxID=931172 RepID=A0AAV6VFT6_9ARAC|nr:hypothetical protein JTE90_001371 [Oedothorax gibbosus]